MGCVAHTVFVSLLYAIRYLKVQHHRAESQKISRRTSLGIAFLEIVLALNFAYIIVLIRNASRIVGQGVCVRILVASPHLAENRSRRDFGGLEPQQDNNRLPQSRLLAQHV
jgi:hypothetical protein